MLAGFAQDLRHGTRMLFERPGFTLAAVLSIAIGVGANAAMFSVADGLVLRPLSAPRAGEIVAVSAVAPGGAGVAGSNRGLSYADYRDLRDQGRGFAGLLAYRVVLVGVASRRDEPARSTLGLAVSGNFFDVLEIRPALGRFFRPEEDRVPGRDAVVVLSHAFWTDAFGADPAVVGRDVRLGGIDFTVIGVVPPTFGGVHLVLHPAYYVPVAMTPMLDGAPARELDDRGRRLYSVKGRLRHGVSLAQAQQEATLVARALEDSHPDTNRRYGLLVRTDFDARFEERGLSAPTALTLVVLAVVVLLVACANVAGLLLSRAPERQREIALRLAIGGGRWRVTRQLLTEGLLLAAGGAVIGLAAGYGVIRFFQQLPLVSDIGVRLVFALDRRAVAVGIAAAAGSTLVAGLFPAWRASRADDLVRALRGGPTGTARPLRLWGRNGLVAGQVALALILVTVTVFLGRAFRAELEAPGFRTERMLLAGFEPSLARYDDDQALAFYRLLREQAGALPGVTAVGMTSVVPLNQDHRDPLDVVPDGFALPPEATSVVVPSSRIDEGYLATMEIPVMRGRGIGSADTSDTPRVALVNEAMAARYWPGQDPIGKRLRLMNRNGQPWAEIVGVTADSKYTWIGEAATPWVYLAQAQDPGARTTLLLATTGDAAAVAAPLRDIVGRIDPNVPLGGVLTMEDYYRGNATGIVTTLVAVTGGMGVLGLILALVGLYALVAYAAARRTREIGIRMAVGARPGSILRMVLQHGTMITVCGVGVGTLGSVAARGALRGAFPIDATIDASTYLVVVPAIVAVTLLASLVPALRAARIDPLAALRQE